MSSPPPEAEEQVLAKRKRRPSAAKLRGYGGYIPKLLKICELPPDMSLSSRTVEFVDSVLLQVEDEIARRAIRIAQLHKKKTVTYKHVVGAVRSLFPPQLATLCAAAIERAVSKFARYNANVRPKKKRLAAA
jgi:hypothetical protein